MGFSAGAVPSADFPLRQFAHEVGHHFGQYHTFAPDCVSDTPADVNCGDGEEPCTGNLPDFAACSGLVDPPWHNIMSYHLNCQTWYGGDNKSLTAGQADLVWRSINEYWDPPLTSPSPPPDRRTLGGWENLYVSHSGPYYTGTDYARGNNSWNTLAVTDLASWTRGNVRLVLGDFNGDGLTDALVSKADGTHLYRASSPSGTPVLTYVQTLNASARHDNSSIVVGNVTGDDCDDALITTSSGTRVWQGAEGGNLTEQSWYTLPAYWGPILPNRVIVGDFDGTWDVAKPNIGASQNNYHSNLSYDDVVLLTVSGAALYRGGLLSVNGSPTTTTNLYNSFNQDAMWAGNVRQDHHDELLVRSASGLRVIKGSDAFSFADVYSTYYMFTDTAVDVVLGNFAGDYHADFITVAPYDSGGYYGSRLWVGGTNYLSAGDFVRPDLVPSVAKYAVAQTSRGGYDDAVIYTTAGSFLYVGVQDQLNGATLLDSGWHSYQMVMSSVEWFGRK